MGDSDIERNEWYMRKGRTKGEERLQRETRDGNTSYTDLLFIKGQGSREGSELI